MARIRSLPVKYFANLFWIHLPPAAQKLTSRCFAVFFRSSLSRFLIVPFSLLFGQDGDYLGQFEPDAGKPSYRSYADFFERRYRSGPRLEAPEVWPCEGFVCDWGLFAEKNRSQVKGQDVDLNSIFGSRPETTRDYFFTNIFLHNHNYHRVHTPLTGTVKSIMRIPGELNFLRPWFYARTDVSYPAFRNERVIFEISDANDRPWYLAMVGGFGVGTIIVAPGVSVGTRLAVGDELAKFNMGSTVCLATPRRFVIGRYMQKVTVGSPLLPFEHEPPTV